MAKDLKESQRKKSICVAFVQQNKIWRSFGGQTL